MMTAKVPQSGTWLPWSTTCILVLASLLPQLHGQPTNETNSNWNSWTDGICSRTCGGGVMKSTRTCVDKSNKGCHGNKVKYTSCNTQDCPDDLDFRSVQCADFNQKPIKDIYYEWVPYLGDDADRCALVCSAVNGTLRQTMKEKVVDGTPCNAHGTEVCVDGTCKSVGCDRVLGSSKVEDACRICGGEGKHCKTVKKSVETTKLKNGYNDFLVIPKGATNILVKNRKDSENHFALRTNRGKFLLNGKWKLVNYSKFHRYGTTFYYINDGKRQQLSAVGPTSTNLILVLVVKEKTADIEYEYSIQKEGETSTVILRHLEPSAPVKQQHGALNQSNDSQKMYISSEMGASRIRLHDRKTELSVNPPLMPMTAKETARGSADGVDDDGSDDDNIDGDFHVDADDDDDDDHKVTNKKLAFVPVDPSLMVTDDVQGLRQYEWNFGGWTECSVSCGAGVQRRVVMCYDVYKRKNVPERCDRAVRPASTKSCHVTCNIKIRWVQSGWTECSETCDGGQMSSIVKCMEMSGSSERQVGDNLCIEREGAARRLTKKCNEQPCERIPVPELPCWKTVYGCCPDRRTAAEGPGHAGCSTPTSCLDSRYGCCPDQVSYARGPNYAGCPGCRNTDYGCCPDGVTTAEGPNYAGCSTGTTVSVGGDCSLKHERGTCSDYTQKWAYDHEAGSCKQFWYGGCGGNKNRFDSERDCLLACRDQGRRTRPPVQPTRRTPTPSANVHCSAEPDRGTCSDYTQKWAFDTETRRCKQFWYGGCGGNTNRFDNERDCLVACRDHRTPPVATHAPRTRAPTPSPRVTSGTVHCSAEPDRGTCSDYTQKWAFDTETRRCKQFWYGGCGGNTNRFDNERDCLVACRDHRTPPVATHAPRTRAPTPSPRVTSGTDHCSLEHDRGTCSEYTQKWGFDPESRRCKQFWYGGCGGNDNRFDNERDCLVACRDYRGPVSQRPTTRRRGCQDSRYGCCDDRQTAARGPNKEGCPERTCADSRYGCCPDGVAFARGPDYKGCRLVGGCSGTRYGCCADGVTAARGHDSLGCPERHTCRDSAYGCCPDGVRPAHGPNYHGCEPTRVTKGCQDSRYGCCDDRRTAARGPNKEGCPERTCADSRYGCCPDGVAFARGPDYKGCRLVGGCSGTRYGCCTDGVTAARGHDSLGCPERHTCRDSVYGCCPDGVRPAHGPNYHGCEPTHVTESDCTSNKDGGSCSNHAIKWFYDRASSTCQQFWYGGCGGNGNRYDTEEDCRRKCHHRVESHVASTTPSVADDVCKLPKAIGSCRGRLLRWYFDHETVSCQKFYYGGCHGNDNNFNTEEECVHRCFAPNPIIQFTVPPNEKELSRDPLVVCHLGVDAGACDDQFVMWYYDAQEGECKTFNYTGCYGNSNRYKTKQSCEALCNRDTVCNFPEAYGQCNSKLRRYRYDQEQKDCIPFRYSGCNGNANNFHTAEACRKKCGVITEVPTTTISPDDPTGICQLKQDSGTCYTYTKQWFFNMASKQCEEFAYGGCGGNANRFANLETCQRACQPFLAKPTVPVKKEKPTDICSLLEKPIPCDAIGPSWYYNMTSGTCQKASPGYCLNNRNSFKTQKSCEYLCDPKILCQMPAEAGLCYAYMPHYFYNKDTKLCERFVYGGCGGNANRFPTIDSCMDVCKPKETKLPLTPSDVCLLPKKKGHCYAYIEQYFYNRQKGECEMFVYGGCDGNANRFSTYGECRLRCGGLPIDKTSPFIPFTTPATTMTTTELRVVSTRYCHLKEEVGSCTDIMYKWFYDIEESRCKKFLYSGCGGNNNRYDSKEECDKICQPEDICSLSKESGICYSYSEQYYFNMATRQCEKFVYGGCGGNANRFPSIYKCERLCAAFVVKPITTPAPFTTLAPTVPKNVCHLPKEPGNCYSYSEQYFFNSKLGRCERFVYGGCEGNANRFATFLECRNTCEPKTPLPVFTFPTPSRPKLVPTDNQTKPMPKPEVCHLQKIVGPCSYHIAAWYHDSLQGVCSQFKYSGCGGNQNNFKTKEDCEKACKPKNDLCDLPRNTGRCHNVTHRWHFSKKENKCVRFAFTGCGGNANNFETEDECRKACKAPGESAKDVCHFTMEIGSCKGAIPSWYYDMSVGQCKRFLYGGCEGNKNRFKMKHECEAMCNKKDICQLPEDSGICYAYSTAYFYDSNMKKCRKFVYGGCGGNANRFPTISDCYNVCGPNATAPRNQTGPLFPGPIIVKQPMKCKLPASTGSCQDIRRMWYYDHVKEQCDQFFYSGCGGNNNRFDSELECLASCRVRAGPDIHPPTIFTVPPFIAVTPTNNIIKLGVDLKKKVVLQCGEAVGYTVTWSHNGKDILPDNRHDIRGWELVIHDVDYKDVGLYTCRRNDDITDTPLERYQLNIKDSLQLIIDKSLGRFHEGDTIKLKCHTNGYPYTDLQWYYKNYPVRSQGRITAKEGLLMIDRATFSDSGIYTCKGKYRNEQVGKDVRVHVLPKPNEVTDECVNKQDILPTLQCRIIVTSQLCDQRAFRTQCCASCQKHRNVIS